MITMGQLMARKSMIKIIIKTHTHTQTNINSNYIGSHKTEKNEKLRDDLV